MQVFLCIRFPAFAKSNSSSVLYRALAPQLNPCPRLRLQAGERVALGPKNQTLEIVLRVLLHRYVQYVLLERCSKSCGRLVVRVESSGFEDALLALQLKRLPIPDLPRIDLFACLIHDGLRGRRASVLRRQLQHRVRQNELQLIRAHLVQQRAGLAHGRIPVPALSPFGRFASGFLNSTTGSTH